MVNRQNTEKGRCIQTSPRKGKKKSKEREREEEEGNGDNEDRVRHVPEALAVSLSRREPTAAGLLPLPGRMQTRVQMLLHTCATRLHAAAGPGGEAASNKGKKKPSSNELPLCLWFLLVVRRVQSCRRIFIVRSFRLLTFNVSFNTNAFGRAVLFISHSVAISAMFVRTFKNTEIAYNLQKYIKRTK